MEDCEEGRDGTGETLELVAAMDKVCRKCIGRGWFDENRSRTVSRSATADSLDRTLKEFGCFDPPGKKSEMGGFG